MNENDKPINKVLAQGFIDGGMQAAFNYPGFFSHELFRLIGGKDIQLNEKHTYSEAFGSSLAGKRTLVSFKNVGLNIAADTFLHSQIGGVGAGLVLLITDDIDVWGSQESQDSRHFMDFYGGVLLEPRDLQEAYSVARKSFSISERYRLPVVIRVTNEHLRMKEMPIKYLPDIPVPQPTSTHKKDTIVHPFYWIHQYKSLRRRLEKLSETKKFIDYVKADDAKSLIITAGATESLETQTKGNKTSTTDILRITLLPLSAMAKKIITSGKYEDIVVIEYGQPYVHEKVAAISHTAVRSITPNILANPKKFTEWAGDENLFKAISGIKQRRKLFVFSDVTRSTVETLHVVDASLSYGSAISVGVGYAKSAPKTEAVISVVGDGSLNHEGLDVFSYATRQDINLTVVIVDNGGLWCTGGQQAAIDIETELKSRNYVFDMINIDDDSVEVIESSIAECTETKGLSIILAKAKMGDVRRE